MWMQGTVTQDLMLAWPLICLLSSEIFLYFVAVIKTHHCHHHHLWKKGVYFSSQCQVSIHHGGEIKAGTANIHTASENEEERGAHLLSSLDSPQPDFSALTQLRAPD